MAAGIPPPPLNSPSGSYYWLEWYTNLTNFLNNTNIPWSNINFTGSNITDLQQRYHNSLTHIQGGTASGTYPPTGNAYHLRGPMFIGTVDNAGNAVSLPSGWTSSGTNPYVITHNQGLGTNTYVVVAIPTGGATYLEWIQMTNNSFTVQFQAPTSFNFIMAQPS